MTVSLIPKVHKVKRQNPSSSEYATLAETRALVRASAQARQSILDGADMLTCAQAAGLMNCTRDELERWMRQGRAICLRDSKRRSFKLPKWQFEEPLWGLLPAIARGLRTGDGWALYSFLQTPLGGLQGRNPRQAIEAGAADLVLRLAGND